MSQRNVLHTRRTTQWTVCLFIGWFLAFVFGINTLHARKTVPLYGDDNVAELIFKYTDCLYYDSETNNLSFRRYNNESNVVDYFQNEQKRTTSITTTAYLRHFMFTKRRGPVTRYIPEMLRLEPGINKYVTEAQVQFQTHQHGQYDCKILAYHSDARYLSPSRFSNFGRFNFVIYEPKLFIDQLLNPLNRRNKRFYRYRKDISSVNHDSLNKLVRIAIRPRFKNDQLTSGYVDMDITTGAVSHFLFHFRHNLQRITIEGETGKQGYELLVPVHMRIESKFKLFGNYVHETTDVISKSTFICSLPQNITQTRTQRHDLTKQCMLRFDTARVITSSAYFDTIRPKQLCNIKNEQRELYKRFCQEYNRFSDPDDSCYIDSLVYPVKPIASKQVGKAVLNEHTQDVLLSSHAFNLTNNGTAKICMPPIVTPSMFQWSGSRGLSLRTRLKFNYTPIQSVFSEGLMEFSPSLGYSFKQRQLYWALPYRVKFAPRIDGRFAFDAGGGSHSYSGRQADELREQLRGIEHYDSLISVIDHFGFNDYRDTYLNAEFSFTPHPDVTIMIGSRYHRRALIEWNNVAAESGLDHYLSSFGPHIEISWTPAQYFYQNGKRRIPLYSRFPTFLFCYERGYNFGAGETNYERFETDMRYRLPLYAIRSLYFRVGAGFFVRRGKDCFLDYDFFRFNYVPDNWKDELTGEFQLLNARWYNESRYYVRFTSTYESPMMLFSRVPGLSSVVQKERVYVNLLSVRALGFYSEFGYGISTHLLDAGLFTSIASDRSVSIGAKFVLHFFE